VTLSFPDFNAAVLKLHAPGVKPSYVGWAPFRGDATEAARKRGWVWAEAVLTRRNTFGSVHRGPIQTKPGPNCLHGEGPGIGLNYAFYASGLLEDPVVERWTT
jgi:hypothetical protein